MIFFLIFFISIKLIEINESSYFCIPIVFGYVPMLIVAMQQLSILSPQEALAGINY